jgi:hypothetical protein
LLLCRKIVKKENTRVSLLESIEVMLDDNNINAKHYKNNYPEGIGVLISDKTWPRIKDKVVNVSKVFRLGEGKEAKEVSVECAEQ